MAEIKNSAKKNTIFSMSQSYGSKCQNNFLSITCIRLAARETIIKYYTTFRRSLSLHVVSLAASLMQVMDKKFCLVSISMNYEYFFLDRPTQCKVDTNFQWKCCKLPSCSCGMLQQAVIVGRLLSTQNVVILWLWAGSWNSRTQLYTYAWDPECVKGPVSWVMV